MLLAGLFMLAALTQFFLVGLSMFEDGARWQDHTSLDHILGKLPYVTWVPAVLDRAERGMILGMLMLYVLFMAQYAFISVDSETMRALQPLSETFLLLLGTWITQRAVALARIPPETSASQRERQDSVNSQVGQETA